MALSRIAYIDIVRRPLFWYVYDKYWSVLVCFFFLVRPPSREIKRQCRTQCDKCIVYNAVHGYTLLLYYSSLKPTGVRTRHITIMCASSYSERARMDKGRDPFNVFPTIQNWIVMILSRMGYSTIIIRIYV